jgi:two-component system KDP operon response regulator KdpE
VTRVLVIDDEVQIGRALRISLVARGYEVQLAYKGETGLASLAESGADVVILDLGLPDLPGFEVLRRIRSFSEVPVIVLTVRDAMAEKVRLLDAGADDFVTKPFAMEELLARMRATMRRKDRAEPAQPVLRTGDLEIDLARQLVTRGGTPVHLTPTEYRLLEAMATQPGKLLTHRWLVGRVWGPSWVQDGQSGQEAQNLRVYVLQLRKKLEPDPSRPTLIVTEPALGYRWAADMLTSQTSPASPASAASREGSPVTRGLDQGSPAEEGSHEGSRASGG